MQELKTCCSCKISKPREEFSVNKQKKDGLSYKCKSCQRDYSKSHHKLNKDKPEEIARRKKNKKIIIENNRKYVVEYLEKHPCVDCGEKDIVVLDFDHVKGQKSFTISKAIRFINLEKIKLEIEKCDVRCANCHRIKTCIDFNHWRVNK